MSSKSATPAGDGRLSAPAIVPGKKDLYEVGEIPPLGHVPRRLPRSAAALLRSSRPGVVPS